MSHWPFWASEFWSRISGGSSRLASSTSGKIGADAAQISRYEHGRITPSTEALVRLAQTFDVSCDYLLIDDALRRRFRSPQDALGQHLAAIAELDDGDRELVTRFIDALATKTRLETLAGGVS